MNSTDIFHSSLFKSLIYLIPTVDLLDELRRNCGTPNIASINTAKNPITSTNTGISINKYINKAPILANRIINPR